MIQARQAHLAECAVLQDFTPVPPGVDAQLHEIALCLEADLVELYAIELNEHTLTRWFLWLLEVPLASDTASAPVGKLYRRRLSGDEPTKEEWGAAWTGTGPVAAIHAAATVRTTKTAARAAVSHTSAARAVVSWAAQQEVARDQMRTALFDCARGEYK